MSIIIYQINQILYSKQIVTAVVNKTHLFTSIQRQQTHSKHFAFTGLKCIV